jgi:hypothetical protein
MHEQNTDFLTYPTSLIFWLIGSRQRRSHSHYRPCVHDCHTMGKPNISLSRYRVGHREDDEKEYDEHEHHGTEMTQPAITRPTLGHPTPPSDVDSWHKWSSSTGTPSPVLNPTDHHGPPTSSDLKPTTLEISTYWESHTVQSEYQHLPTHTTIISAAQPETTTSKPQDVGVAKPGSGSKGGTSMPMIIGAVAGILLLVAGLSGLFWFCWKKNKRKAEDTPLPPPIAQMKLYHQASGKAFGAHHSVLARPSSPRQPFPSAPPGRLEPSALVVDVASPFPAQPVILGPIGGRSNRAYNTGIDTSSDTSTITSVPERNGLGNPFADDSSLQDEPPPPYRPRSIGLPSLSSTSRNSSLRAPPAERQHANVQSPFGDPDDDDHISEVSGPTLRGDLETMSAVSDLSYQDEPIAERRLI